MIMLTHGSKTTLRGATRHPRRQPRRLMKAAGQSTWTSLRRRSWPRSNNSRKFRALPWMMGTPPWPMKRGCEMLNTACNNWRTLSKHSTTSSRHTMQKSQVRSRRSRHRLTSSQSRWRSIWTPRWMSSLLTSKGCWLAQEQRMEWLFQRALQFAVLMLTNFVTALSKPINFVKACRLVPQDSSRSCHRPKHPTSNRATDPWHASFTASSWWVLCVMVKPRIQGQSWVLPILQGPWGRHHSMTQFWQTHWSPQSGGYLNQPGMRLHHPGMLRKIVSVWKGFPECCRRRNTTQWGNVSSHFTSGYTGWLQLAMDSRCGCPVINFMHIFKLSHQGGAFSTSERIEHGS